MTDDPHMLRCRVLIIEDEKAIRKLLRTVLQLHGSQVLEAPTGHEGMDLAATAQPDLIIHDLTLPDQDGMAMISRLRQQCRAPILVLSGRSDDQSKVQAFDAGADDYLTKPFSVPELLARLRRMFRHSLPRTVQDTAVFQVDDLRVDLLARLVTVGGQRVRLTANEYRLLTALIRHAGQIVSYGDLLCEMFGPAPGHRDTHYLQVYVYQLRRKIEPDPQHPRYLKTEPGIGLCLAKSPERSSFALPIPG